MGTRDFSKWLASFRNSINGYDYYVDFEKVYEKAVKLKCEIALLATLIGSKNIETDFKELIKKYPECLRAIPLLLAVRKSEIYCEDVKGKILYKFNNMKQSADEYCYFMCETGLFKLLSEHIIANLYDYITGVEVGLNSNGRKNRGGHQMENLISGYLTRAKVEYYKEMYISEIEKKWSIDLAVISANGTTEKRFDFVVKMPNNIYAIETNFYTSGGSKLNEVARSYKMIAEEVKAIPNFKFVWITDGAGWNEARHNLEETFDVLPTLYNIHDLEQGKLDKLFFYDETSEA